MPCFVIGPDDGDERVRLLARLAGQLGHPAAIVPDLEGLGGRDDYAQARRPLVIVPDASGHGAHLGPAIRFAQAESSHAYLVYVADTIAPEAYKQLVRTGAAEWTTWEALPAELREVARTLSGRHGPERTAKVVSFWPSKGGVGNTTLALESGVDLASRRKRSGGKVAILDLNFGGGTLADALDLEPRFDIREITDRPDRLDEQLIDVFTSRHSPRLDIFASPIRPVRADEVDPAVVFAFIDAIGSRYELVLLDIPTGWLPWIDNVLQGSDVVVATGAGTVPAVKQLVAKLGHLDGLAIPAAKLAVAVNGCAGDLLGRISRKAEIDRALGGRRVFYVRRDSAAVDGAIDVGRPLTEVAPKSRVARDIAKLARWAETAAHAEAAAAAATLGRGAAR